MPTNIPAYLQEVELLNADERALREEILKTLSESTTLKGPIPDKILLSSHAYMKGEPALFSSKPPKKHRK